ncbi:hypothetical protein [Paraburkholderia rhynchosiae]|uniref:Uncharacterized protein n=1 Tax=Paraburkholderia rhynchosiae TaxID=487049 RepID=A0A2N7W996_9BURK|nr:hypothetical protein [Paraburkholderia rhynchosiae]PMS25962.1 hypothetical protein C0Z16_27900 [Paraburkholderia rhynchosiae]CAB3730505.1 hypothetical protein LMG27174_05751 [Paraburkholderia rhynchosiae]
MNARTLADVAQQPIAGSGSTDVTINMFSAQGFALAQRLANAYQSSNAVPAPFRSVVTKREKRGDDYVDVEVPNPSAMGNCIVAIETAQAVGMSITAVMQNANIIEGRLTWSAKFVIAAINASGRFHPLRFDLQNLGIIKATYKEKGSWNKQNRKYDMIEKEVEIENLVCVAWTLPRNVQFPRDVYTLADAKAIKLPVIESSPVSMRLAVEEGWYSKPGSKWQTEMKYQMLQYRAGSFFGNIHAPDVVMGMGRTTEEAIDTIDVTPQADGTYAVSVETLRTQPAASSESETKNKVVDATDVESTEKTKQTDGPSAAQAQAGGSPASSATASTVSGGETSGPLSYAQIVDRLKAADSSDALEGLRPLINDVPDPQQEAELVEFFTDLQKKFARANQRASRNSNRPSAE